MTYKEAREFLDGCNQYAGEELTLEPLREMLRRLGDPQEQFVTVHIAGTNGKGSTLAFVSSVLQEAGYRVGRYISPTIFEYRERIQINGNYISEEDLARLTERVQKTGAQMLEEGWDPAWRGPAAAGRRTRMPDGSGGVRPGRPDRRHQRD